MHLTVSTIKRLLSLSNMVNRGDRIVIACLPKTASTFLQNVIAEITGYPIRDIAAGYGDASEQDDLDLPLLVDTGFGGFVTHMHSRATDHNIKLMKMAKIKPIVLSRSIFDITVSVRDHVLKSAPFKWPMMYFQKSFLELEESAQYDYIIDLCLPWFFSFYSSWYYVEQSNEVEMYWLTYEDFIKDKPEAVYNLCALHKINVSRQDAGDVVSKLESKRKKSNINVGRAGRGAELLTDGQLQRIRKFADYYPDVDFSRFGL